MKKLLKWVYFNKVVLSSYLALILYFIESIFNISERLCIPKQWYYTASALVFVLVSIAIKGKGTKGFKFIEQIIEEQKRLKDTNIIEKIDDLIENKKEADTDIDNDVDNVEEIDDT